jgi:tetratricopeptide (TPR) repeat protein
MSTAQATGETLWRRVPSLGRRFAPEAPLLPGLLVVALMLVWAVHDGGYDEDTWYWGALVMLALFTALVIARGVPARAISRAGRIALAAFALYVAWSYLSIAWAQAPGVALSGSNRALLYLLVFATMLVLPWTPRGALIALLTFAIGVGVIAIVLLFRLASDDRVASLVIDGRLAAPTGYFNSTAALFMMESLVSIALATRRELPGPLRGLLIGFACAGLQLAVIVQSRGWLFTLPIVAILTIAVLPNRMRVVAAAVLPVVATLVPVHRLLAVFDNASGPALGHAAASAGRAALMSCAIAFFVATLVAWGESVLPAPAPSAARRRALWTITTAVVIAAVCVGTLAATHGDPVGFVKRQWNGFSHQEGTSTGSHFADVGSGRYDFWRVGLDALIAHPIGGLGQDNFADYYVSRRRTGEEPAYTHSLEVRLLAHTGIVGSLLFAGFLAAAIAAALRARRRAGLATLVAATALLPLIVWVIHGSVDWFWEFPALSAPALGFLAMAGALGSRPAGPADAGADALPDESADAAAATVPDESADESADSSRESDDSAVAAPRALVRALTIAAGALAVVAAVIVLGFPYLSVREVSVASNLAGSNLAQALRDLRTAADLNPLNADPGRFGGTYALQAGEYATARQSFSQAAAREPQGWYAWFGAGLASSALGDAAQARHDYQLAARINPSEPVIRQALAAVDTAHPLSPAGALQLLNQSF